MSGVVSSNNKFSKLHSFSKVVTNPLSLEIILFIKRNTSRTYKQLAEDMNSSFPEVSNVANELIYTGLIKQNPGNTSDKLVLTLDGELFLKQLTCLNPQIQQVLK